MPTPARGYFDADGKRIPSYSTIASALGWNKGALMWWANQEGLQGRNHRDSSQRAADAGTVAHKLIELHLHGQEATAKDLALYPDDVIAKGENALLNFVQWEENVSFEVVTTEQAMVSEIYKFGGTVDCIARVNGKRVVFDWKSGSGVYPETFIQVEAYRHLWDEGHPDEPIEDGLYVLRIDKETVAFDWHYRFAIPEAWEAFLLLRKLHDLKPKIK